MLPISLTYDHRVIDGAVAARLTKMYSLLLISIIFDNIVLLQPTSPLRSSKDIDKAISIFIKKKSDSLFSSVNLHSLFWTKKNKYIPTNYNVNKKTRTVVLFPGSGSINRESSDQIFNAIPVRLEFLMKINAIVAIPVYKSTYERRDGLMNSIPFYDYSYRDRVINWSKDLQLTVDYLETLKIVDKKDLHYFGFSWGARVAGIMLATEKRFKSAILVVGGLRSQKRHPEADPVNYLTRVKIPILMFNGKYDPIFPFKSSAEPMFNYFGTEIGSKKMYTFETGHFVPRNEIIKHSVMWLNDLD